MSSALDQECVILVSSVAHLRDGNTAFKVWNEHSSSVLPSGWGKKSKTKICRWWHFNNLHCETKTNMSISIAKQGNKHPITQSIIQQLHYLLKHKDSRHVYIFGNDACEIILGWQHRLSDVLWATLQERNIQNKAFRSRYKSTVLAIFFF